MIGLGYTDVPPGHIAAVTTFLEMTEPPATLDLSSPPGVSVRRVASPVCAWYRDLFRAVGAQWLWSSRLRLNDDELNAVIRDPRVDIFALVAEGKDKGILEIDRREFPSIELAFFGVTEDMIGRGAGRFLINTGIRHAFSFSPQRFFLHTCSNDHPRALAFYQKTGFRPYKRSIEVSPDPRITGVLPPGAAPGVPVL